jgi:hypothetical protein
MQEISKRSQGLRNVSSLREVASLIEHTVRWGSPETFKFLPLTGRPGLVLFDRSIRRP